MQSKQAVVAVPPLLAMHMLQVNNAVESVQVTASPKAAAVKTGVDRAVRASMKMTVLIRIINF